MSNWLHDTMKPGTRFAADGPFGDFTSPATASPKYLFLSGGSGITPLMSMTRTLYDLAPDADIIFVHSARSPAESSSVRTGPMASNVPPFAVARVRARRTAGERTGAESGAS